MENQITVLTDRLESLDSTISSLVKSDIPLTETTGLQRKLRELTDNVTKCTRAMGSDHARLYERLDNAIKSNTHNHDHKRPRHDQAQVVNLKDNEIAITQESRHVLGQAPVSKGPNPTQGAKPKTNNNSGQLTVPNPNVENMEVVDEVEALSTSTSEHVLPRRQAPTQILQRFECFKVASKSQLKLEW